MKYILLLVLGTTPQQIGPFDNVFACEQALTQVETVFRRFGARTKGVCINLAAKPHHWNGKKIPK